MSKRARLYVTVVTLVILHADTLRRLHTRL